ncbi:MAG: MTH938/NDUFAF3 family protein [Aquimonas sp.]|nr:MTH938/NDUFAF3 family protein [Aquimonas sp.]
MPLAEERAEGIHVIRWVASSSVRIDDLEFGRSLLVMPDRVWQDLPARRIAEIDPNLVQQILALAPELVLLGTGERQQLAPPALLASFLQHGVGLEAMDNAAAARTYNLLAFEGRRVAAILLIDSAASA